jgi:hypothetical protein
MAAEAPRQGAIIAGPNAPNEGIARFRLFPPRDLRR